MWSFIRSFLLFTLCCNAFGESNWLKIRPLTSCLKVEIEYQEINNQFSLRSISPRTLEYFNLAENITDINDLSSIQDELFELEHYYCGDSYFEELEFTAEQNCGQNSQKNSKPFQSEFIDLISQIIKNIDNQGNNCDDVVDLIALQNNFPQLDSNYNFDFKKSHSIVKLFTDKNIDQMIDHFYECGGSKGSGLFIKNLIVLESKKSCIFPSPPGFLQLDQVIEIANSVAKSNENLNLISLNSKQNKIIKETSHLFIDKVLEEQTKNIFGESIDAKSFYSQLPTYQKLKEQSAETTLDFISFYFTQNIPLEFIDNGLDYLLTQNIKPMLPKDLSDSEKTNFINNFIIPPSKKEFNECIADYKREIYPKGDTSIEGIINYRKDKKEKFCQDNIVQCEITGCGQIINYSTQRTDIKDQNKIQACVYKSIDALLPNFLEFTLENELAKLDKQISGNKDLINTIKEDAEVELRLCINKSLNKVDSDHNEALLKTEANDYINILNKCGKALETNLTKDIAKLTILKNDAMAKLYNKGDFTNFKSEEYSIGLYQFAEKMVTTGLNKCLEAQQNHDNKSATLCQPMIEIEVAGRFISDQIKSMLPNHTNAEKDEMTRAFSQCVATSQVVLKSHFNEKITTSSDAANYLEQNHTFYNCFKSLLPKAIDEIASIELDKLNGQMSELKVLDFFEKQKPEILKVTQKCMQEKIDQIPNWNSFKKENEKPDGQDFITVSKQQCTNEATEYALTKIVPHIIAVQSAQIPEIGLKEINENELANHISSGEKSLGDAISKHFKKAIQSDETFQTNSYMVDLENAIQTGVISQVYNQLFAKVDRSKVTSFDINSFRNALSPQCLSKLYTSHKENIANLQIAMKNSSKPEVEIDPIRTLVSSLENTLIKEMSPLRKDSFITKLYKMCETPEKIKTTTDFKKAKVFDPFLASIISDQVILNLKKTTKDLCLNDTKNLNIGLDTKALELICSYPEKPIVTLLGDSPYLKNMSNEQFLILDIIRNRMKKDNYIIDKELSFDKLYDFISNDKEILDFVFNHFSDIALNSESTMKALTLKITEDLFFNEQFKDFSELFIENQLVGGIGTEGYSEAKKVINQKASEYVPSQILPKVTGIITESLSRNWTYNKLSKKLNWKKIEIFKRKALKQNLFENIIMPILNKSPENELNEKKKSFEAFLTNHLYHYPSTENVNYKLNKVNVKGQEKIIEPNGPKHYSFMEAATNEVKSELWSVVPQGLWQNIKESLE